MRWWRRRRGARSTYCRHPSFQACFLASPKTPDAFSLLVVQTVALGQKMDIQFSLMRLAIVFGDWTAVKDCIKKVRLW